MSDLDESPSIGQSWVPTTIGALGRLYCGQSPPSSAVNTHGEGTPYVSGPDQWDGYTIHQGKWTTVATRVAPAHSIFITVKGAGVGTLFPGIGAAIGRDIYAFEPHPAVDLGFVYRALQFSIQDVIAKARGDIPGLRKSHILDHPVSVPGVTTQRKVASKIDELFSRIEEGERALERVQKLVERYRHSVLKAAVTGELTRGWRERNKGNLDSGEALLARIVKARREAWEKAELDKMKAKGITPVNDKWKQKYEEPSSPDIAELPELPEGWVWATTEQVCASVRDGTHDTPKYVGDGIPLITSKNLHSTGLDFDNVQLISREDHEDISRRSGVSFGDILFAMIGTIGNPVVVMTDREFSIKNVGLFKANDGAYLPEYLTLWLRAPGFNAWLEPRTKGTSQKFAPLGLLRALPVPLPPLDEQREIVDYVENALTNVQHLQTELTKQQSGSIGLRQSVLKASFSGVLVPQHSSDEPVSLLLERINTERGAALAKPKRGAKSKTQEPA